MQGTSGLNKEHRAFAQQQNASKNQKMSNNGRKKRHNSIVIVAQNVVKNSAGISITGRPKKATTSSTYHGGQC